VLAGTAAYNPVVHFVYIVRCADGTLYTGCAIDPHEREKVHNRGRGARYTSGRRPVSLVYIEALPSIGEALRRERALKRLTRVKKEALIASRGTAPGRPQLSSQARRLALRTFRPFVGLRR
jgi:predicted GIY-YIG superfamily endonuclease